VYALYKRDKLYYVGLAVEERHLKELETLVLRITGKPPGNKVLGKFKDSENLKKTTNKRHPTISPERTVGINGPD